MREIDKVIAQGEEVLWEGKPSMWPFLWTGAILSAIIGVGLFIFMIPFIIVGIATALAPGTGIFSLGWNVVTIPFVLIALWFLFGMPVYKILSYKNIYYAITNKRVIIQSGVIGRDFAYVEFDKVQSANVNVGFWDKIFGDTGSIIINSGTLMDPNDNSRFMVGAGPLNGSATVLANIEKPYDVFKFFQKTSFDVKTDIEYPNAKRPASNPGYNTKLNNK